MTTAKVISPYEFFADNDGSPLEAGYIYVGVVNLNPESNPINVYWDSALTQPASQPIRTVNGYPSRNGTPSAIYANSDFSMTIKNKKLDLIAYEADVYNSSYFGTLIAASSIATVADFASLASTPAISPGMIVYLKQHTSGGLGGGPFQDSAGTIANDGGTQINNTITLGRYWKRINYSSLTSEMFGGNADGTTDNFLAITNGLAAVSANGKGALWLPPGTSCTSSSIVIPPGCTLRGAGFGGNWATGDGVGYGTSPSFASRLLYTGTASRNIILMGDGSFDTGVQDLYIDGGVSTTNVQAWATAFNASSALPPTIIGIRSTSTLGTRCKNVRIQNVIYGLFLDSTSTHSNAFGAYENIVIQTCCFGVLMAGIYNVAPVSNQGFTNLKVTGYYNRGIDFRVAADSNIFTNTYLSTSIAPSAGVYYNSSSPGIDQGIGFNNFNNIIMDLFNPAPGDNGMRSVVCGYTSPGYSYMTSFISPVSNAHYSMQPEIRAGGLLFYSAAVSPSYSVSELNLWCGGPLTLPAAAAFATIPGVLNFFNVNHWNSAYTTVAAIANFRKSGKIIRIDWVTYWNPGSSGGSIQLWNDGSGSLLSSAITPGSAGAIESMQDVTDLLLSLAGGATPNYITPNDFRIAIQSKGNGVTAPILYRSYLRVITSDVM